MGSTKSRLLDVGEAIGVGLLSHEEGEDGNNDILFPVLWILNDLINQKEHGTKILVAVGLKQESDTDNVQPILVDIAIRELLLDLV